MGIETHVLAPDDPRWIHRDDGLRMPSQAWIHRSRYVGVSGGKPSEVLAGTQGLERAVTRARLQLRRLVVPDENATWAVTAIPAGIRLVREHGIDVVVSTSPPPSTHLIAAAIARATGVRWVADLRDSLVFHAHRRADTTATKAKAALHERVARLVASRADAITCVSEAISEETRSLEPRGPVVTIPNGADFDDVAGSRAAAVGAVPHHAHRELLRTTRPAPLHPGARGLRPRRRRPLSRRLSRRRPGMGGGSRPRRSARAAAVRDEGRVARAPARLRGAAPPHPRRRRPGQGRPLGQGVRVRRGRAPDSRLRPARRGRRGARPRHRRRRRRPSRRPRGDPRGPRGAPLPLARRSASRRRPLGGVAGPALPQDACRGDGRRAARYPD